MTSSHKITSLFLIIVLLLTQSGYSINRMTCLKSGKTKISFTPAKNCCADKNSDKTSIKSNCCDILNTGIQLDDFSTAFKITAPSSDIIAVLYYNVNSAELNNSISSEKYLFADLPPPWTKQGRTLLAFISTLRI